jgi:hypothetical protein
MKKNWMNFQTKFQKPLYCNDLNFENCKPTFGNQKPFYNQELDNQGLGCLGFVGCIMLILMYLIGEFNGNSKATADANKKLQEQSTEIRGLKKEKKDLQKKLEKEKHEVNKLKAVIRDLLD